MSNKIELWKSECEMCCIECFLNMDECICSCIKQEKTCNECELANIDDLERVS